MSLNANIFSQFYSPSDIFGRQNKCGILSSLAVKCEKVWIYSCFCVLCSWSWNAGTQLVTSSSPWLSCSTKRAPEFWELQCLVVSVVSCDALTSTHVHRKSFNTGPSWLVIKQHTDKHDALGVESSLQFFIIKIPFIEYLH